MAILFQSAAEGMCILYMREITRLAGERQFFSHGSVLQIEVSAAQAASFDRDGLIFQLIVRENPPLARFVPFHG
jgi:hypothetical protein